MSWGATGIIRRWLGVDDAVDHNSGYYSAGEWIGTIHSTLIGGAKGWAKDWEMLGSKAVPHAAFPRGLMYVEESHVIPARFKWVPDFIRNSKFNIKPLWGIDHAMSDAKRFNFLRKSFKDTVVEWPLWKQVLTRTPSYVNGSAVGLLYGRMSAAFNNVLKNMSSCSK